MLISLIMLGWKQVGYQNVQFSTVNCISTSVDRFFAVFKHFLII